MRILYIGKTDFSYNRTQVIIAGLENRSDVQLAKLTIENRNTETKRLIYDRSKEVDFVVVPPFRHRDLAFVKSSSRAPVVFDPLISRYLTRVVDYGMWWKSPQKYIVDWIDFRRSDLMLWDTKAHLDLLKKKFKFDQPSAPIYIGVDQSKFYPIDRNCKKQGIRVGFYGSYNPLQGIDKIIKAAHLLRDEVDIHFELIGFGAMYKRMRSLAEKLNVSNITFTPKVPYDQLNDAINRFDICLGVYGDSIKTDVVIPNKIYHYAAAKKCIITKDTKAIREVFIPNSDIVTVQNTPEMLAQAILTYATNHKKRATVAMNGYKLIVNEYNQDKVANKFVDFLKSYSNG